MKKILLQDILKDLENQDDFLFLETKRMTRQDYKSYLFAKPLKVISCSKIDEVKPTLDSVERMVKKGYFAAGFLSYEAGFAFEESLEGRIDSDFPLLWFGIYKDPAIFDHRKETFTNEACGTDYSIKALRLNRTEAEYIDAVGKIKSYIEKGQTYQVNYTLKLNFEFSGSTADLYSSLRRKQGVSYSALMRCNGRDMISLSPELFFRKKEGSIQVKPMKGTLNRGRYPAEDTKNEGLLHLCPKNRSENIMIVDLLRNDLGKICQTDTVKTRRLFEVENYESILQMTSTVEGRVRPKVSLHGLFSSIFPSGSVTGAPKIKTMQIIDKLEKEPRRIYTGAIGFISPHGESVFNVAIRTLLLDRDSGRGEMGIGSGVVYDSDPGKEYAECRLKANFLTQKTPDFCLIETMLWQPGKGCHLLDLHMERLAESAAYFKFSYDKNAVLKSLKEELLTLHKDKRHRVRLLLSKEGKATIASSIIAKEHIDRLIIFSDKKTSSSDSFLFHKTTNRRIYDEEYKRCRDEGFYDMIFQNQRGEITEGAISNIFIKKGGIYYTPPIECGLLNGVYRRHMLRSNRLPVREKVLYRKDIIEADGILLANAVRGMVEVKLIDAMEPAYA